MSNKIDLESLGIYLNVPNMDAALIRAVAVWDAFWGPFGEHEITKQTLTGNIDIVTAMVAAVSESLIQSKIDADERARMSASMIVDLRKQMLTAYSELSKIYIAHRVEITSGFDAKYADEETKSVPLDDSSHLYFKSVNDLPRWVIQLNHDKVTPFVVSHNEYVMYFSHVD